MNERDELVELLRSNGMQSDYYNEAQADAILDAGYRKPTAATQPPERKEYACAVEVWDGPYKMKCSYMIVNDRCVRHGAGKPVYEVEK